MDIIVVGTSEYFWALKIFARQFNLYFDSVQITHYGNIECDLPDNFMSRRVPCFTEGVWNWTHWYAHGLKSILEELTSDIVLLLLPDHWICEHVDKKAVRSLKEYMIANPEVVRGNLTAGTCLDGYGISIQVTNYEIVQVHPNHPHCGLFGGAAGSPALWNRKNLLELLESSWSFHDTERIMTEKMRRLWPEYRSVGIKPGPIVRAHGLSHKRNGVASFKGMKQEDVKACSKMLPEVWSWKI